MWARTHEDTFRFRSNPLGNGVEPDREPHFVIVPTTNWKDILAALLVCVDSNTSIRRIRQRSGTSGTSPVDVTTGLSCDNAISASRPKDRRSNTFGVEACDTTRMEGESEASYSTLRDRAGETYPGQSHPNSGDSDDATSIEG
jgi:hypothetical protein